MAKQASRWVQHFIDVNGWPAPRKVTLCAVVLLCLFALQWAQRRWIGGGGLPGEFALFDTGVSLWASAVGVALLAASVAGRRARDARWAGYLFTVLFLSPVVWMTYFFESVDMGFAPLVFIAAAVLFLSIYFDEHVGASALGFSIAALFLLSLAEGGLVPPGRRVLEAVGPVAADLGVTSLGTLLFTTAVTLGVLCLLSVSARRAHEGQLRAALERALQASRAG